MSSRTIVLLKDDVDGSKADETVEFGLDGSTYAIDLSDSNAKKLRGALDGYITKARKVSGKRSTPEAQLCRRPQSGPCLGCLQRHPALQPRPAACLGTGAVPQRRQLRLSKPQEPPRLLGGS